MKTKNARTGSGWWRWIAVILVTLSIILFVMMTWAAPISLKQKIETLMEEKCPSCEFHLQGVKLNPATGLITFNGVKFVNNLKDPTTFRVSSGQVKAWFRVSKLISHEILIDRLEIDDLVVFIEEAHNPHPPKPDPDELRKVEATYAGKFLESLPLALVEEIVIKNAKLEYILDIFKDHARIMVSDINAELTPLGTRKGVGPRFVEAHLTGQVQHSGLLTFACRTDLFLIKNEDQIQIDIQHLPMPELDTFFTKEDGLVMGGEINEIRTSLLLTEGHLTGALWANYKDLVIHIEPTPTAGPIKVFFENVIQNLKTAKTKPAPNEPPPMAEVNYQRKPGESLINFILQGLKAAAFKVIAR